MHLVGHLVDELGIEDDGVDGWAALHRADRLVEESAPPSHPHAGRIHGRRGDDHEVDIIDRDGPEQLAHGFGQSEETLGDVSALDRDRPVEKSVRAGHGQQDPDAARHRPVDELARARLGRHRQEARDGARADPIDQLLETVGDGVFGLAQLRVGSQLTTLAQISAKRSLDVIDVCGHAHHLRREWGRGSA